MALIWAKAWRVVRSVTVVSMLSARVATVIHVLLQRRLAVLVQVVRFWAAGLAALAMYVQVALEQPERVVLAEPAL